MIKANVDIAPYTTFGISARVKSLGIFSSTEELCKVLKQYSGEELTILGGGSNVLFTQNYNGLVLVNRIKGVKVVYEDDDAVEVQVGAGENWHEFVLHSIENGWGGIENLSLIPGSVGASPMQNIGAYGVEIKDVFKELTAFNIATREEETFDHPACEFGYRESVFKRALKGKYIITSVTYRLSKQHEPNTSYGAIEAELERKGVDHPTIKDVSDAVISIRQTKLPDPKKIGNAGSFFKNPVVSINVLEKIKDNYPKVPFYPVDDNRVKVPAGWLIDTAGWKGKRFGDYGVHTNQALVLVNYDNAEGQEIYDLSQRILEDVKERFDIELEREVNIIE
ncbi:MAG: UDP-N-acetylmuramate dehydrogenase [Bacteroidota bacterium]